jgi:hypothetical protein
VRDLAAASGDWGNPSRRISDHNDQRGRAMTRTATRTNSVLSGLDKTRSWQEEFYRHLHQHPELSHEEHNTAAEVAKRLAGFWISGA